MSLFVFRSAVAASAESDSSAAAAEDSTAEMTSTDVTDKGKDVEEPMST